jgi:hypothetical protein
MNIENIDMDIENIAKLDLFLKKQNGFQNICAIDNLIIIENDQNAVKKLKDAAYFLQNIQNTTTEDIRTTWNNLFAKQIRYSVNRVKQKRKLD